MARPRQRDSLREPLINILRKGGCAGPALVTALGINQRTLTRLVADLRAEGLRVESVRDGSGWSYRLIEVEGGR